MTFNNTYYALKSNTGKFMAIVYNPHNTIYVYDEELADQNMQHILFEHIEDAQDVVDDLLGNNLIEKRIEFDQDVEFDKIVKLHINFEVTENELT